MNIHMPARCMRLAGLALALLLTSCGGDNGAATGTTSRLRATAAIGRAPAAAADYTMLLQRVYLAYFGRPADPAGLAYYAAGFAQAGAPTDLAGMVSAYATNTTVKSVIDGFGTSAESQALYPGDNGAFITAIYANLFNRTPDAAGKAYWAGLLDSGLMTRGNAAIAIMGGAQSSDATIIDNKTQVAANFTAALNTSLRTSSYDGLAANVVARALLAQVGLGTDPAAFQASVDAGITVLARTLDKAGLFVFAGHPSGVGNLDGPAGAASFNLWNGPAGSGAAVDRAGNIYIADTDNHTIRRITPAGAVSTFAGTAGSEGRVDGPPGQARLSWPQALAFDSAGNLFVTTYNAIRKITPAGTVTTVDALVGSYLAGLCIDAADNLYVADTAYSLIYKVTPQARASVIAGHLNALPGETTRDGVGTAARFAQPQGLAIDANGVIYVADTGANTIRRISRDGTVTTIAGSAGAASAIDGVGAHAQFLAPRALVAAAPGTLYVVDGDSVRSVTGADGASATVTTIAGRNGTFADADGSGADARFALPTAIALDGAGKLIVNAYASVRRVAPDGSTSTIAGQSVIAGSDDGAGGNAKFGNLGGNNGVYVAPGGDLFVADRANGTIRKVTPAGAVSTVAGLAGARTSVDGPAAAARFKSPGGLVGDSHGAIFVLDNAAVRRIAVDGSVSTFAGSAGSPGWADGTGTAARFAQLGAILIDADDNLYVLDFQYAPNASFLIKITPQGRATTLARLDQAYGLARDADGNFYATNYTLNAIQKVTPNGTVSAFAGLRLAMGDSDGTRAQARFNGPAGIAYDPADQRLYVADQGSNLLRAVSLDGSVTTVAGTRGLGGMPATSALPGSLPEVWAVTYVAPKVFILSSEFGLSKIILP